ncbi:MAG: hypothetical protein AAF384_00395 [Pseudomonadota bacterium]
MIIIRKYGPVMVLLLSNLALARAAEQGTSYTEVYRAVFAEAYSRLPQYAVDLALLGKAGDSTANHFREAARRTLRSTVDLFDFPAGQKLLQPNGICFAGIWQIDASSPFSGLLSAGTRLRAIVRASVSLSETEAPARRAFGLAIKIFPAATERTQVASANFFVMDTIAGSSRNHVLDAVLDNEPPLGGLPEFRMLGLALRIRSDLQAADREVSGPHGGDYGFRPVAHLANVNESQEIGRAPHWLRLSARSALPRINAKDFRDELRVENYPDNRIVYRVDAAEEASSKSRATWRTIGELTLSESITSPVCDQRLHFAHPQL